MKTTTELVTPAMATKWLNDNKNNRKLRPGIVERYSKDMKAGNWTMCPTPIVFYEDNLLADGQHRLWAIIDSDTSQTFIIVRGFERAAGLNIDIGKNRDLVDNARIAGIADYLTHTLLSVCRAVEDGCYSQGQYSNTERFELVERHKDAGIFAVKYGPKGKFLRNAMVLGAIARAYEAGVDRVRLQRFCEVVNTGFSEGMNESAAVSIRNYLQAKGQSRGGGAIGSSGTWTETFLKVQNAIKYFVAGKQLNMIKTTSEEAYPLKKPRVTTNGKTKAEPKPTTKRRLGKTEEMIGARAR